MATTGGLPQPSVIDELYKEPQRFGFYQLVRLLEMLAPDSVALGEGGEPALEAVRFRSSFSLAFPPSDIVAIDPPSGEDGIPTVTVSMLGLGGAHGPLPHNLTDWVLERNAARDHALRDFLDIFDHRLVSLLFRVRQRCKLGTEWTSPEEHHFAEFLYALMGMLTEGLRDRLKVPDRALLRYAGLLTKQPRDAMGLERMLTDHFGVKVICHQLRGMMRPIEEEQWTKIGLSGQNQMLGSQALVGTMVWDQQAGVELEVGPLPWNRYLDFLPGQPGLQALIQLARFYIGPAFEIFVALLIKAEEIPRARLSQPVKDKPPVAEQPILGLTSFLSYGTKLRGTPRVALGAVARYSDEPLRATP